METSGHRLGTRFPLMSIMRIKTVGTSFTCEGGEVKVTSVQFACRLTSFLSRASVENIEHAICLGIRYVWDILKRVLERTDVEAIIAVQ